MQYKGFEFRYFSGEITNPFTGKDSNAALWWDGEKMFYENISRVDGDEFIDRLRESYERGLPFGEYTGKLADVALPIKDRLLIFYLDSWHGKWFPYDDLNAILNY